MSTPFMSATVSRLAVIAVTSAITCGIPGGADAQLLVHKDISLAMATTIARATIEACKAQGYNVSVHVLGREGQVILGVRNENASLITFENSMKKAYTARTFARSSGEFAAGVRGNPNSGALFLTNITPAQGALPIKIGNETIGAVGVSGAPGGEKDEACAKAGIDKIAADLQ
jgi:uncharacterized protein GlcG (DUF336 family)